MKLYRIFISYFKSQLGTKGEQGDAINMAFAVLASNTTNRGKTIFNYLAEILADTEEDKQRRVAAANILSMTNLPKAAEVLIRYRKTPEVLTALVRMGDLAVEAVKNL